MSTTVDVNELFNTAQEEGTLSKIAVQSLNLGDITPQINQAMGINAGNVQSAETVVLSILIDDSGSIRLAGNSQAIRDGHNMIIESLMKSKQKDSIFVHCRYLNAGTLYPYKQLDQVEKLTPQNYDPNGGTPLYDETSTILATAIAKVQEFAKSGITSRAITLIMTDGSDQGSIRIRKPEDLNPVITDMLKSECHIVAAMGVEEPGTSFIPIFQAMGIPAQWILTPRNNESEIRKAFAVFSQSALRASQGVGGFSQQAMGGFTSP